MILFLNLEDLSSNLLSEEETALNSPEASITASPVVQEITNPEPSLDLRQLVTNLHQNDVSLTHCQQLLHRVHNVIYSP